MKKKVKIFFFLLMLVSLIFVNVRKLHAGPCEDWLWECELACQINPDCDSSYCVEEYIKCISG